MTTATCFGLMGRLAKSRHRKQNKAIKRNFRTENRGRDLDQIFSDLEHPERFEKKPTVDPDLPGQGQFYDRECARHFQTSDALEKHLKSKVHRRRLKQLKEKPYDPDVAPF